MKNTEDFKKFQVYFNEYQKRLGLTGYRIYFKHEPLEASFASIGIDQGGMAATVRLNSELPEEHKPFKDVKKSAKHEALHLLISRLELTGQSRFISKDEIYEATEELVNKLDGLIDDN